MIASHPSGELAALLEGQLAPDVAASVRAHVAACGKCGAELDEVRSGLAMTRKLPLVGAPDHVWRTIERGLDRQGSPWRLPIRPWRLGWAAALLAAVAGGLLTFTRVPGDRWEVTRLAGTATLGSRPLEGAALAGAGNSIRTGRDGRVRVRIGRIGTVDVEPDTEMRLVALDPRNHRLVLSSGSLTASINAPPRLFFVETPSATAVDLGCEYTLRCDRAGSGMLSVTAGWVAFEWNARESLVPAGAVCRTRPRIGPGTPYFADASPGLVGGLDAFDTGGGAGAVDAVLREARVRDTLSLWHLLSRVAPGQREAVYERMAGLSPPPAGVSKDAALRLDPAALTKWREELAWTW